MLRVFLLDGIGCERRDDGAAAGDDPDKKTDDRSPEDRPLGIRPILEGREDLSELRRDDFRLQRGFKIVEDFAEAEDAHREGHEVETALEDDAPEGEPDLAGDRVETHHRQQEADEEDDQSFDDRAAGEGHGEEEPQRRQGEIFGGAEIEREFGERRREEGQADDGDRAGDERSDRGDPQGRARASFLGHLVAVDAGDDGGRLAGEVQQDGGGRSAVHRSVVDARHHDDRRHRGADHIGHRQQKGDCGRRPQARKYADRRADQRPEEAEQDVCSRKRDGKTVDQASKDIHRSDSFIGQKIPGVWAPSTGRRKGHTSRTSPEVQ